MFLICLTSCEKNDKKIVVCWGDSLTAPHVNITSLKGRVKKMIKGDDSYPAIFAGLIGDDYEVINCGVGGENTITIMARQGAYPMALAHDVTVYNSKNASYSTFIGSYDIPAFVSTYNGSIVTPLKQQGYSKGSASAINPCYMDGCEYLISSESSIWKEGGGYVYEYNYFIECENVNSTYTIPAGTVVETYAMQNLRNKYANIFFIGQNGGFEDAADLIKQLRAMIKYSGSDRFIVISYHKPNKSTPTVARMEELEDSLNIAFGKHFINLRTYMVSSGLDDAALSPTSADVDSVEKGRVPPQLLSDGTHFTSMGYRLIGELVANKFKELGY